MMKNLKIIFFILFLVFITQSANGQIQKGNWLVGGSGGFSFDNQNTSNFPTNYGSSSVNSKTSTFLLKSNVGYFIKDRLAIGVNPNLYLWNSKLNYTNYPNLNNSSNSKGSSIGLGLFTRYYLLNNNQNYNFIGEVSYGLDKFTDEDTYLKKTSISIGPVLFLNKNTSLDFLLNYTNTSKNYPNNKIGNDIISFNFGFQIYL